MATRTLKLYIDYKSPYAYLAVAPAYRLAGETGGAIDWLPYILDIPAYLGSARLDADGKVREESRNAHQWRRVKYSYMDVRREANRVGLTIRGTQKIWDSTLAGIGLLHARRHGAFRPYNDEVFERFWRRYLDIESVERWRTFSIGQARRASRPMPKRPGDGTCRPCRTRPRAAVCSASRASCSRMVSCSGAASISPGCGSGWKRE